jgi:hypothetical protein
VGGGDILSASSALKGVSEFVRGIITSSSLFVEIELKTLKQCVRYIAKKLPKSWWDTPAGRGTFCRLGKSNAGTVVVDTFALGEVGFVDGRGETCKHRRFRKRIYS